MAQRLIDADALIACLQKDPLYPLVERYGMSGVIDAQPTIAEPVRHGKWTVTPVYIKCSECGESFMLIPQNYCPNCGADMRGEEE